jgi:hypothetical protein
MNIQIEQIISAGRWCAVMESDEGTTFIPLVCWARGQVTSSSGQVVESGVFGMIADGEGNIIPARSNRSFSKYDVDSEGIQEDFERVRD